MTAHAHRVSAFEKGEQRWSVSRDRLGLVPPGAAEVSYPLDQVAELRVTYAATRLKPWRKVLALKFRNGTELSFDNGHYLSPGRFEDRSESFFAVAQGLIDAVEAASPGARFHMGETGGLYVAQVLFAIFGVAVASIAILLLPLGYFPLVILAKVGVIILMIWPMIKWLRKARPRPSLDAVAMRDAVKALI